MYIYIICIVGSNKQVTAPRCGSAMSCARQNETVAGCINDMCGWTFNEDWTLQRAGLVNSRAEGYITHQTRHTIYLNWRSNHRHIFVSPIQVVTSGIVHRKYNRKYTHATWQSTQQLNSTLTNHSTLCASVNDILNKIRKYLSPLQKWNSYYCQITCVKQTMRHFSFLAALTLATGGPRRWRRNTLRCGWAAGILWPGTGQQNRLTPWSGRQTGRSSNYRQSMWPSGWAESPYSSVM